MSEWIQNCAIQGLYSTRDGRFFWLPKEIGEGIRDIGVPCLLPGASSEDTVDLIAAFDEMETVKSLKAPSTTRVLPETIGPLTPAYAEGDWVPFNAGHWKAALPEDIFIPRELYCSTVQDGRVPGLTVVTHSLPGRRSLF